MARGLCLIRNGRTHDAETASAEEDFMLVDPQNQEATQGSTGLGQDAEGGGHMWARALTVASVE